MNRLTGRRARPTSVPRVEDTAAQRHVYQLQQGYHLDAAAREQAKAIGMLVAAGGVSVAALVALLARRKKVEP